MNKSSFRRRLLGSAALGVSGVMAAVALPGQALAQSATCSALPDGAGQSTLTCTDASGVIAVGSFNADAGLVNGGPGLVIAAAGSINGAASAIAPLHTNLNGQPGLQLDAGDSIVFDYRGNVTTTGVDSIGVSVSAPAAVQLNVGAVSTSGDGSGGIIISRRSGATIAPVADSESSLAGEEEILTAGAVTTRGVGANGVTIRDEVALGNTLANIASVETNGNASAGISFRAPNPVLEAGNITTNGLSSAAVDVSGANVVVNVGDILTTNDFSDAVTAIANAGTANVTVGNVETQGRGSYGVSVTAVTTANVNLGHVSTQGNASSYGVRVLAADVTLSTGDIVTRGDTAQAVSVNATAGNANVTIHGNISTGSLGTDDVVIAGTRSQGVVVVAAADVNLTLNGNITTRGGDADALAAVSYGGGAVHVAVGDVSTMGINSDAIYVSGDVVAAAATVSAGNITTTGTAAGGLGFVNITDLAINTGNILTSGDGSIAIYAPAKGELSAIVGDVTTLGAGAPAIYLTGTEISLVGGNVSTSGGGSAAVYADAVGPTAVTLGDVSTLGDNSTAIDVNGANLTLFAGNIATSGRVSGGIVASGFESKVTVGHVSTQGQLSSAIDVFGYSNVALETGSVSTRGDGALAVSVVAATGSANVTIGGNVSTGSLGTNGLPVTRNNDGVTVTAATAANVIVNGDVTTLGNSSSGVTVVAATIDSTLGNVTTSGLNSYAVGMQSVGDQDIEVGNVTAVGDGAYGIGAQSTAGNVTVVADNVSTRGNVSAVGAAYGVGVSAFGFANVTLNGDVTTNGDDAYGIGIQANGNVVLNAVNVTAVGDDAYGIGVRTGRDGNVTVAGTVSTAGDDANGIDIMAGGNVMLEAGNISTSGDFSRGLNISAAPRGAVNIAVGNIVTAGEASDALTVLTVNSLVQAGSVNLSAGDILTSGQNSSGVRVFAESAATLDVGNVHVQGGEAITVQAADVDISARNVSGGGVTAAGTNIKVKVGNVSSTGPGDTVYAFGTMSVDLDVGNVTTTGISDAFGVVAFGLREVDVRIGSVSTIGSRSYGVSLFGGENIDATIGNVSTAGEYSRGVHVIVLTPQREGGGIFQIGNVATNGTRAYGIFLYSGSDSILDADNIITGGEAAIGVFADSENGSLDLTVGNVTTAGVQGYGIVAGGVDVKLTTKNVRTGGEGARGIDLSARKSLTAIIGNVSTEGASADGIVLQAFGELAATIGNITTSGESSAGVRAWGESVTLETGNISTSNDFGAIGISAAAADTLTARIGNVSTLGDTSNAVNLYAGGNLTAEIGNVSAAGDRSHGVSVAGDKGAVIIDTGVVRASGSASRAVQVSSSDGAQTINVAGASTGVGGLEAILAVSTIDGAITVNANGDVSSVSSKGISVVTLGTSVVSSAAGADVSGVTAINSVASAGSTINIRGAVTGSSGVSINADGGSANLTVFDGGVVNGAIDLTDAVDTVINQSGGTFNLSGTSNLGLGADSFTNSGIVNTTNGTRLERLETFSNAASGVLNLSAGTTTFSDTTVFANVGRINAVGGLTTLNSLAAVANSGIINLADNATNDVLTISNNYVGSGSGSLVVDYSGVAVDRLVIGGSASGTTSLVVRPTSDVTLQTEDLLVVDTNGTTDNAFVLVPTRIGLIDLILEQRAEDYYLVLAPMEEVFETVVLGRLSHDFWYQSADIYSSYAKLRQTDLDTGRKNGFATWGQIYASRDRSGGRQRVSSFGLESSISTSLETERHGFQFGADYLASPRLAVGVTAGYQDANADVRNSLSGFDASGYNVGAYAIYGQAIGAHAGILAKYDRVDVRMKHPDFAGASRDPDVESYGVEGEIGYRAEVTKTGTFDLSAGLAYVHSDIDGFVVDGIGFEFDRVNSVRGRLGARFNLGSGLWTPFADIKVLHEFQGKTELGLTSGDDYDIFEGKGRRTWGRLEVGVGGTNGPGPSIAGWAEFGDVKGIGIRAGFRF